MLPGSRIQIGICCAAGLLFALSQSEVAAAQGHGSGLQIEGPSQLILGEVEQVPIRVRLPEGKQIQLYVSVGSIEARRERNGWLEAHYVPPSGGHPQVATLVAATQDWEQVGWLPILLSGAPTVQFTFERRSDVTVDVRGTEFGPVRTNRSGNGSIKIVVPPGIQAATAVGIDRMENRRTQSIPLNPAPFQRTFAVCPEAGNQVWVFTVGAHGERGPIAPLAVTSSTGEELEPVQRRPGIYQVTVREGDPTGGESVEVTTQIQGWSGPPSRCSLTTAAPSEVALRLSTGRHVEGTGAPVLATIESRYPGGRVPRLTRPEVAVDFGELGPLTRLEGGRYQAEWRLPGSFSGKSSATVSVQCGSAVAAAELELVGPAPPEAPLALALHGGAVSNFGKVTGPQFQLRGAARVALSDAQSLSFGASVGFWFASAQEQDQAAVEMVEVSVLAGSLLAELGYALWLDPLEIFLRARGGLVLGQSELSAESAGTTSDVQATYAVGGVLGMGPRIGPGLLSLEAGYLYAPLSGSVRGNVAGFSALLGYEVRL